MAVPDHEVKRGALAGDQTSAPGRVHLIVRGLLVLIDRSHGHEVDDDIKDPQQLRKPRGQALRQGDMRDLILGMRGIDTKEADRGRPHTRRDSPKTLQETQDSSINTCGVVLWGKHQATLLLWVLQCHFHTCPLLMVGTNRPCRPLMVGTNLPCRPLMVGTNRLWRLK